MLLVAMAEFLIGVSAGLAISAAESADAEATHRCAVRAQRRVEYLRAQADDRVADVYTRYAGRMSPGTAAAFRRRMAT
jgi:hypothetical protein